MATIRVEQTQHIDAPAEVVYRCIADFEHHHANFLPPAFSDFSVKEGGVGAGTLVHFTVTAGGRSRSYAMRTSEPEPGRVLVETDTASSLVTTFTVEPDGAGCRATITTSWQGASGIGGFFEKRFAPAAMAKIYREELERLDAYARQQAQNPAT